MSVILLVALGITAAPWIAPRFGVAFPAAIAWQFNRVIWLGVVPGLAVIFVLVKLVWQFLGRPSEDKLIGNDQMISHWPCRSGVLIEGDELFFTAGNWSREGAFVYCLDSANGSVV